MQRARVAVKLIECPESMIRSTYRSARSISRDCASARVALISSVETSLECRVVLIVAERY